MQERMPTQWRFRVQLFGGGADGCTIALAAMTPKIAVFRNGAQASARETKEPIEEAKEDAFAGFYELVEPVGSETPIYVSTGSSQRHS